MTFNPVVNTFSIKKRSKQTGLIKNNQDSTIFKFSIKLSFSSTGQEKSKLLKQISMLLILTEMAA